VRLGLIARADNRGLGIQTYEFHRNMSPDKTMVVDCDSAMPLPMHLHRYPEAVVVHRIPNTHDIAEFLDGLDAVFTAETPYNYELFTLAARMGIRTVLQYNFEFLEELRKPHLPRPTVFASPSTWRYADVPFDNKCLLPVPIATDRFTPREHPQQAWEFLHIVGRPAAHDRNGTLALLSALQHVRATVLITIRCQLPGHVSGLIKAHRIHTPSNVTLNICHGDEDDYWQLYTGDVLIMPRRFGGLCLPAQEAIGAGMPVIMPACSPNIDWLPADWLIPATVTGSFHARSSIDLYSTSDLDLAAKIDQFATDAAFYAEARNKAVDIATELSWPRMQPEYQRVLTGAS
jgi:hypothetical protein